MKVLMLVINPMTADARVDKEAASLAAWGCDVTVLATSNADAPDHENRSGFDIVRLPYQRVIKHRVTGAIATMRAKRTITGRVAGRLAWMLGGSFLKVARSLLLPAEYYRGLAFRALEMFDRPDVIHAHDLGTLRAAVRLAAAWQRRSGNRPRVVYDSHELYVEQQTRWKWWEKTAWKVHERRWIHKADAIITVSDGIAAELQRRYRLSSRPTVLLNSPVMPPPQNLGRTVREDLNLDASIPLAVYAGAVKPSRGVGIVIEAMSMAPDWHLALVGAATEDLGTVVDVDQYPKSVRDRIHVIAPVPSWSLPEYLSSATVGIHPLPDTCLNHRLALPNKLFDYAFAGIPVLANALPEMARLVATHDLGIAYDASSVADTVRALQSGQDLLVSPSALEDLSWDQQARQLRVLYENLV